MGTEKLPTFDSHLDGQKGTKTIVYNRKRDSRKRGRRKENTEKKREQKVEEIQQ